jgi:hypothetical protein
MQLVPVRVPSMVVDTIEEKGAPAQAEPDRRVQRAIAQGGVPRRPIPVHDEPRRRREGTHVLTR